MTLPAISITLCSLSLVSPGARWRTLFSPLPLATRHTISSILLKITHQSLLTAPYRPTLDAEPRLQEPALRGRRKRNLHSARG